MTSISRVPHVVAHDETDLIAMIQSIWRQKKLIASAALLVGVIAGGYAFLTTPEYEVGTVLRPAALNDLDALNRSEVYSLPPGGALVRVGAALDSYETRLNYFRANPDLFTAFGRPGQTPEQVFAEFNRSSLKLVQPDPNKADLLSSFIGLQMRYPKGVKGEEILNGFVQYAIENERKQIADDLKVIIGNRLAEVDAKLAAARAAYESSKDSKIAVLLESDNLKRAQLVDELKALRVQLKIQRDDRVAQLDEAINIARSLGLKKPSTPSSMASESPSNGNIIRTEVNNQQFPLYFMGADALEAERRVLRQRTSDDFSDPRVAQIRKELLLLTTNREVQVLRQRENEDVFLKGIESLRAERIRLMNIGTDMQHLSLVNIDQRAIEPVSPIKPNKALLIALGLFIGGLLGMMVAIFRHFAVLRRMRELPAAPQVLSQVIVNEPSQGIKGPASNAL
ncbi:MULTISPECIES: Wzz/FepE/Etk N-terminal domain-containing protein [Pseudomonas]|nr:MULTISPECIES: Wzz/FepE/Etk N-terminal domain-containing protein [Pseudomonas]